MSVSLDWSKRLVYGAVGAGVGVVASYLARTYYEEQVDKRFDAEYHRSSSSCCSSNTTSAGTDTTSSESKHDSIQLPLPLRDTKNNPPLSVSSLTNKQNLSHLNIEGKRVLIRVDYNVKIKNGNVVDTARIDGTLPTLATLIAKKPKAIVIITHLGRPAGNFLPKEYSVEPIVKVLQSHFPSTPVKFLPNCIGPDIEASIDSASSTGTTIFLLENLRFHPEETGIRAVKSSDGKVEKIRSSFAEKVKFRDSLSRLGDAFVFEAFGAAHRPHSSIIGISLSQRVAGHLMNKELTYYGQVLGAPKRPFLAIVGGAKISDKILVLENLLDLVDEMIIGGGMAYTFLKVLKNVKIGNSLFDAVGAKEVHKIMDKAKNKGVAIHLPCDHIIGNRFSADAKVGVTDDETGVPDGWLALDVGPKSRSHNKEVIARASTILWNGPLGVYELGPFGGGTLSAMQSMVEATRRGATTIIGGGDTGSASKAFYVGASTVMDQVSWVSTGGGSSLVLMEGKELPAVTFLSNIGDNSKPPTPDETKESVEEDDE